MSIQQKILQYQGLTNYETYIVDSLPTSKYFKVFSLEDTISGGKSTFQILGSEFLEENVELKIELLDISGNPIYTEPIKYLGDDPSRHIMIEVYPTTSIGVGKLTILGSVIDVPDEWKGLYNVKWEKEVFIDPETKNTHPILFRGQGFDVTTNKRYPLPEIEVTETVTGVVVASGSGGNDFVTSSLFDGGDFDGNASPFARPVDIKDLAKSTTRESSINTPPRDMINAGVGGGQTAKTTYAAKSKNQQNTTDTSAIETNITEQKYEEFHKPQAEPSPPPTPPIPPVASKPKATQTKTQTKKTETTGQGTYVKRQSGDAFRLELAGGKFMANPMVSPLVEGIEGNDYVSSSFTASIVAVHSPDLLELDTPFLIEDKTSNKEDGNEFIPVPYTGSEFTINYEPEMTGSTSEVILQSFAEITIKNMKTFSGDVHRVKVFAKGFSTQGDFKLVSDKLVEASDVLINTGSVSLTQKTGKFINQQHLDNNWRVRHLIKGTNVNSGANPSGSITFASTTSPPLMNAVLISGSNSRPDESIVFETTTSNLKLRPNVDYTLFVNAVLKTGEKDVLQSDGTILQQSRAKTRFYISGSNLSQDLKGLRTAKTGSVENYLGDPIKVLQGDDEPQGEVVELKSEDSNYGKNIDFGRVKIPFKPQFSGSGVTINDDTKLQVEVEAGQLYIQSIELKPSTDTNFNPDEFTFQVAMPKLRKRPDFFDFLIEFYDRDGNKSSYSTIKEAVEFDGENDVIQGTNNLLTGSLSIGNALGAGIEAAGVNSAYIRSVDYAGFDSSSVSGRGGFVMWSGSISRSLNTSESYDGVGIELHDGNSGSFKFRTLNADGVGEFDVRTNKFFFGKEGVQFVSGSDDKIEISSSNFHLEGDGTLTIGADANILGGLTATSIQVPNSSNPLAEIKSTGAATFTSASIGGFNVSETAISSSNGELVLKSNGQITGSNFKLDGGTISSGVTIDAAVEANSLSLPAVGTKTAVITAQGEATFSKAEIGSFKIATQEIRSLSGSLILSASGAITASDILATGNITANAGQVFQDVTNLHATSGALETDISASISRSIGIEETTGSLIISQSDIRVSLTSSKQESDLVAKGFGEKAVVSASAFAQGAEVTASALAQGAEASASVQVTESIEFTREQTGSLIDFSLGAVTSGSTAATESFLAALLTSSISSSNSASLVSASAVNKSLLFSSESITRADTSSSLVLASASAEFVASSSLIRTDIEFASSGAMAVSTGSAIDFALGSFQSSSVGANASHSLVIAETSQSVRELGTLQTEATQSRFEVDTLQTEATQSIGELGTLQTEATQSIGELTSLQAETTTSLNKLGGITTASGSFLGAIGARSASMDATISSSFTLSSASLALSGSILSGSLGTKINPYETQVSLSGDGLAIRKEDETLLAKYGEKTELFANGSTSHKAILDTGGLAIVSASVTSAFFGGTTTIGPEANNKSRVEIGSGAVKIINQDGSGNSSTVLNFDSTGDVTSDNFLLERTRLFGAGGDGVITLKSNTATISTGSNSTGAGKVDNTLSVDSNSMIVNEQGTRVLTRTGSVWSLEGDLYADSLELDNSTGTAPTLVTSGSRIFVKNEFKIDTSCVVHNDGIAGDDGADQSTSDNSTSDTPTQGGKGGFGRALTGGTDGANGSRGGNPDSGGSRYGGNGGGAGGSGGIIFISARFLVNSGSIRSNGGDGGDGGNGKGELVPAGTAPAAGGAGAAGSLINIKV